MLVRTLECDVCRSAARHRAVSNIVSTERGDIGIPVGDWFVVVLHEPAGAERGHGAREIRWHLCSHPCLARWCADQAKGRADALPPLDTDDQRTKQVKAGEKP